LGGVGLETSVGRWMGRFRENSLPIILFDASQDDNV